jgi:hypothetical protein
MDRERQSECEQADMTPERASEMPAPRYGQPGHDFTLQAVMAMQRTLEQFTGKIDRLIEDVEKISIKLGEVERAVACVKIGLVVTVAILSVIELVLWWTAGRD